MKTTTLINSNFIIRYKFNEDKRTSLIGAGRYKFLVESEEMANKHFLDALNSPLDKYTIKLRRGLKIEFVQK